MKKVDNMLIIPLIVKGSEDSKQVVGVLHLLNYQEGDLGTFDKVHTVS